MTKKILLLLALLVLVNSHFAFSQESQIASKEVFEKHVAALCTTETAGRMPGTPGFEIAKKYIINELKTAGIAPFYENDYLDNFEVVTKNKSNRANSQVILHNTKDSTSEKSACYYQPLYSSDNTPCMDKEVVFVGYGISDKENNYDDYEGVEVKDKIVVMLRFDPSESNAEKYLPTPHSALKNKSDLAIAKGACAIIIFNGFNSKQFGESDNIRTQNFGFSLKANENKVPFIQVKQSLINEIETVSGKDFAKIQKEIDENKKPNSFVIPNLKMSLNIQFDKTYAATSNIVAIIPGSDPKLKDQYIVVGGHYDHVGLGTFGSRTYKNDSNQIHPGADDNASGTASVIEIGKYLKNRKLKRSVILILFSAEEMGLYGSISFINHNKKLMPSIKAMINFDMVGMYRESFGLRVNGIETSLVFKSIFEECTLQEKLKIVYTLYSPSLPMSDNSSFFNKGVPCVHYFTGMHEKYHHPLDTPEIINYEGLSKIAKHASIFLEKLLNCDEEILLNKDFKPKAVADPGINLVLNFGHVKILSLVNNLPGEKAGLMKNDIILKMDNVKMDNPYDYYNMLRDYSVDTKIILLIRRTTETSTEDIEVTLNL
jgi:aminopeptidase YwaD